MARAGFVLVGGKSSRMGRNKAFLKIGNRTLAESVASSVRAAAGNVTLVGDPAIYSNLGLPVLPDAMTDSGPLAGIYTALREGAEWNLIAACDMPSVDRDLLRRLLDRAESGDADCILPEGPSGRLEPLCAVYHRRCLAPIENALQRGVRKVTDALAELRIHREIVPESCLFQNLNTPRDWESFLHG